MAVWYRQLVEGEITDGPRIVAPVDPADTDADLLERKATSAAGKGWTVEWSGPASFTAVKDRWGDVTCLREFWIE